VRDGEIIGRGFHAFHGGPHAEVMAIDNAILSGNTDFSNTTLYVTLEPCCHFGKTPPCTSLILNSGIRSVVVGMEDPNPLVAGKGIRILKEAGINVEVGILEAECRELNRIFYNIYHNWQALCPPEIWIIFGWENIDCRRGIEMDFL